MKAIDQVLVEGQGEQFALLAPEIINDYVETLGKPCQNPLGYTAGSLILAKDLEGVQRMFKVTANISSSQNVVEGTNVERKKLEDLFDGINTELGSVKQALTNEAKARAKLGAHNLFDFERWFNDNEVPFTKSGDVYSFTAVSTLYNNYYKFSDVDIPVRLSGVITNGTAVGVSIVLLDSNGTPIDAISSTKPTTSATASQIKLNYSSGGTVTVEKPLLCLQEDAYTGYLPYVPTNAQLLSADTNAVLGAHNFAEPEVYGFGFVSAAVGAETTITSSSTTCFIAKLEQNTNYVFSEVGGNRGTLALSVNRPAVGGTVKVISNPGEVSGSYSASFNSGSYNYVVMYCNSTVTTYDAVKPLLKLASDPSTKFAPYAMTNRELTDAVTGLWETITAISGVNLTAKKISDVVCISVAIPTVSLTVTTWNDIATSISAKYIPLAERRTAVFTSGGTLCFLRVTTEGKVQIYPTAAVGGSLSGCFTYIL